MQKFIITTPTAKIEVTDPEVQDAIMNLLHKKRAEKENNKHNKHWTESDEQLLISLHAEGKKPKAIGILMGRTNSAVSAKLQEFKVAGKLNGHQESFTV